jgi:hypothetical protein
MLRNSYPRPSFDEARQDTATARHPAQRAACFAGPIVSMLRSLQEAWREGLFAHRRYEHLKTTGIPHDTALRQALGITFQPVNRSPRKVQVAAQCRSFPLAGIARNADGAVMPGVKDLADSVDPAPRLRVSVHIGNLAYGK